MPTIFLKRFIKFGLIYLVIIFVSNFAILKSLPFSPFSESPINVFGILALIGNLWATFAYFTTVGIFLIYAPFSKIHHYLYYPFARIFYGSGLARKGLMG